MTRCCAALLLMLTLAGCLSNRVPVKVKPLPADGSQPKSAPANVDRPRNLRSEVAIEYPRPRQIRDEDDSGGSLATQILSATITLFNDVIGDDSDSL